MICARCGGGLTPSTTSMLVDDPRGETYRDGLVWYDESTSILCGGNQPHVPVERDPIESALEEILGCIGKLEDATYGRATWERAGRDIVQVLPTIVRRLQEARP